MFNLLFPKIGKNFVDYISSKMGEIILGGQDGIVNTLGVILGISAATSDARIILAGGFAAAIAESISMAAVAYTSKQADYEYYVAQREKEKKEIIEIPESEKKEIEDIFRSWGVKEEEVESLVDIFTKNKEAWVELMLSHELNLAKVDKEKPLQFAITVGIAAVVGSFIPILPFLILGSSIAWIGSLVFSGLVLLLVGYYKSKNTIGNPVKNGIKLMVIGIVSALAGFFIGSLFGQGR